MASVEPSKRRKVDGGPTPSAVDLLPATPGQGKRLQGQVCCVVGAGQQGGDTVGNGRAVALVFAREGAKVFLVDVNKESVEETGELCAQLVGEESVRTLARSVGREADCKAIIDDCVAAFGRIDVLHNNVGIAAGDAGTVELSEQVYDRIMSVNLSGTVWACKHALVQMRKQQSGCIINVSSIGSVLTLPGGGGGGMAYKMSKAAMNHLTQNMAMENAQHGVRVNAILPGLLDTPLSIERRAQELAEKGTDVEEARRTVRDARNKQVPLFASGQPCMGSAWDVANSALFLASADAKFITGVLLAVDGGQCVKTG